MLYGNFSCPGGHLPKLDRTVIPRKGETSPALNQRIYSTLMSRFNRPNACPWALCLHAMIRAEDKHLITPPIACAPEGTTLIHKNPDPGVLLLFCSVAVAHHYVALLCVRRSERWGVSRSQTSAVEKYLSSKMSEATKANYYNNTLVRWVPLQGLWVATVRGKFALICVNLN